MIGLPGETVELRDGRLFVDGVQIPEPYLKGTVDTRDYGPVKVPQDALFVLGDNRLNSNDSRFGLGIRAGGQGGGEGVRDRLAAVEGRVDPPVLDLGRYERGLREQGLPPDRRRRRGGARRPRRPARGRGRDLAGGLRPEGINDSKVLTALQRDAAFERIVAHAVARSVCRCTPTRIDRRGLHKTNVWLLRRASPPCPSSPTTS